MSRPVPPVRPSAAEGRLLRCRFRRGTLGVIRMRRRFRRPGGQTLTILSSSIDASSTEFASNAQRMRALIEELRTRRAQAALGGNEKARARHVSRGKLLPRDRVMNLIDPGSPFLEIGALAAYGMYDDAIHGAGMIAGIGRV